MNHLSLFFRLGRIKFLSYSPILFTLGSIIASGKVSNIKEYILGLFIVWLVHLSTHYWNEFFDFDTDSINLRPSPWTGGSRVLPNRELEPSVSLKLGILTSLLGLIASLFFSPIEAKIICWIALFLAIQYSAPPLKLSRHALGELDTTVVLNILTPLLGYVLQNGALSGDKFSLLIAVLTPLAIVEFVRMMVMNFADRIPDAQAGKTTFPVLIGMPAAIKVHAVGMILAYVLLLLSLLLGVPTLVVGLVGCTSILGFWLVWLIHGSWDNPDRFFYAPYWASIHNGLTAVMALVGFFVLSSPDFFHIATYLELFPIALYCFITIQGFLKLRSMTQPQTATV